MKTIAARFDDPLFEAVALVANLEETTIVDQIREAVETHIALKMANGDLAARAQAALDDIDREAEARKEAIGSLIGKLPKATAPAKGRSRRGQATAPEARLTEHLPIGYLASRDRQERSAQ